jgi:hypothetical protein
MATDRTNIGNKFEDGDIPSHSDFKEIFDSFVHKDEDKADFQMVETGTDTEHYVTPALLRTGLQNIGIITGNSFMPHKENFEDSFSGTILPLTYFPIPKSVKVFKNGQLLQEGPDYTVNYDTAQIKFLETVTDRNLEVDYWYKNLSPSPGSGSGAAIDFTSFLHTSGNETKNGLLTFNNTAATSTSGIILKNSGAAAGTTSLDVTNSGAGSGISLQNSSTGTGVKVSNAGAGVAVNVNSEPGSTGDILQVSKNNVVKTKIDSEGNVTAKKFVTSGGTDLKFVKGDGSLDPTTYADDTKVIHTEGNESKDGALTLRHDNGLPEDVLTIIKNNSANCLKLVQNSSSNATTSTFDTTTEDVNRKAISIQKVHIEKAFITHDGNVSGTSFTTLNEKADITDGFLTLGDSTSPVATANHAKLYAKTDGTTDMYVMGSDGVEKKIGGVVDLSGKENTITPGTTAQYYRGDKSWQTLDKTAVGLVNIDNTSDLNKPVSTATQAALNTKLNRTGPDTFTGTLTIDSGNADVSGLVLNKIPSNQSTGKIIVNTTNLTNQLVGATRMADGSVYVTNNSQGKISKIAVDGTVTTFVSADLGTTNKITKDSSGNLYVANSEFSGYIIKILPDGTYSTLATAAPGASVWAIVLAPDNNLYTFALSGSTSHLVRVTLAGVVTHFPPVGGYAEVSSMCIGPNGNIFCFNGSAHIIYEYNLSGVLVNTISMNWAINSHNHMDITYYNGYFYSSSNAAVDRFIINGNIASLVETINVGTPDSSIYSILADSYGLHVLSASSGNYLKLKSDSKVLKTNSAGLVVKTQYLEDVPYLKASDVDLTNLVTKNNIKTINGLSLLGSGDIATGSVEPSQITITTAISITTDTLDANGKKQLGKNVIINNGASAINITVNGGTDFSASYLKHGTGAITFVQGSGRTLVIVDGIAVFNGVPGSTATISSVGTTDYLRISNA